MRRFLTGIAIVAIVGAVAGCSTESDDSPSGGRTGTTAQDTPELGAAHKGDISLRSAWASATLPTGPSRNKSATALPMSAGYAEIVNAGSRDEKLVGASSPAADMVELHETVDVDGSAGTMKAVDHIVVPADGSVTLSPGGYHLMIMGLHHRLRPGSKIEIDLRFASGTRIPVEFSVIDRTDRPSPS